MEWLQYPVILVSGSPRRKELMRRVGFNFQTAGVQINEDYPGELEIPRIPVYLARKKAEAYNRNPGNKIVVAADTIVVLDQRVMDKPRNRKEAFQCLEALSGRDHRVITGVVIKFRNQTVTFNNTTKVYFRKLDRVEIEHYLDHYQPYDKAGAYGIQEWIGLTAIQRIDGSYFNVMGLPVHNLYRTIKHLIINKQNR